MCVCCVYMHVTSHRLQTKEAELLAQANAKEHEQQQDAKLKLDQSVVTDVRTPLIWFSLRSHNFIACCAYCGVHDRMKLK